MCIVGLGLCWDWDVGPQAVAIEYHSSGGVLDSVDTLSAELDVVDWATETKAPGQKWLHNQKAHTQVRGQDSGGVRSVESAVV